MNAVGVNCGTRQSRDRNRKLMTSKQTLLPSVMSLPQSLRTSVTPPELELIACQQLIEIIPLLSMEKTAFISILFVFFNAYFISCNRAATRARMVRCDPTATPT